MSAEQPIPKSQYEALKSLGFFRKIDGVIAGGLVLAWVVTPAWNIMCHYGLLVAQPFSPVIVLLVSLVILCIWAVLLIFRCMYFVLMLTSTVKLMPYEAARIASSWRVHGVPE